MAQPKAPRLKPSALRQEAHGVVVDASGVFEAVKSTIFETPCSRSHNFSAGRSSPSAKRQMARMLRSASSSGLKGNSKAVNDDGVGHAVQKRALNFLQRRLDVPTARQRRDFLSG